MGTINYRTSKYIALGIYPECSWDYEKDPATMEELREYAEEHGITVEEEIELNIQLNEEADYDNASWILDKYSFNNYTVQIEPGYYQGFSIDIREELPECWEDYREKQEAQREITKMRKLLEELNDTGIHAVYPGWCTTYRSCKETKQDINEAIREMRAEAKAIPCWSRYEYR